MLLQEKDRNLGYEHGYSDVKYGRYEKPCGTEAYNRGYEEGAQARRDFAAANDQPAGRSGRSHEGDMTCT